MNELKNCGGKQKFGESFCSSVQLRENSTIINRDNFGNDRSMHYYNKIILRMTRLRKENISLPLIVYILLATLFKFYNKMMTKTHCVWLCIL